MLGDLKYVMRTLTKQKNLTFEVDESGIATLWLDSGQKSVVILDRMLIQRLNATLDAIQQTSGITGLILCSNSDRVFVAGADLSEIDSLDDPCLHAYLAFGTTVFGRIAELPYPTIAIINGAALGGGLEIAMHCDQIIASKVAKNNKPYPIGLPEAGLGICPGWGGSQMLAARIDPETAIHATAMGNTFMSSDLPKGLAEELVETPEELQDAAKRLIKNKNLPNESTVIDSSNAERCAMGLVKAKENTETSDSANAVFLAVETGISCGWTAAVAIEQCELVRLRNTPAAREKLDAFLSKG